MTVSCHPLPANDPATQEAQLDNDYDTSSSSAADVISSNDVTRSSAVVDVEHVSRRLDVDAGDDVTEMRATAAAAGSNTKKSEIGLKTGTRHENEGKFRVEFHSLLF